MMEKVRDVTEGDGGRVREKEVFGAGIGGAAEGKFIPEDNLDLQREEESLYTVHLMIDTENGEGTRRGRKGKRRNNRRGRGERGKERKFSGIQE